MSNVKIVKKAIEYIEVNLKSDIDVPTIAQEVGCSLYHFIRLFHSHIGLSPKSYLQQRRLTEAMHQLNESTIKIADIAYDYQFGSPETFSRAFRKQFNLSPKDARKGVSTALLPLLGKIDFESASYTTLMSQSPEIVELNEMQLIGISFFASDEDCPTDLSKEWGQFMKEQHLIRNMSTPSRFLQVQFWSETQDLNGLNFFIGAEVDSLVQVNPYFVIKIIPSGRYLRFIHRGFSNKVGDTYQKIYNQYLSNSDYLLKKPFNFELYGDKYLGPFNEFSETEIYIPIE